jgi:hypothetical protein
MKPNVPTSRFEEQEVDHLIGAFGIKPSPENRRDVLTMLREQKEQFKQIDRHRDARDKGGRDQRG